MEFFSAVTTYPAGQFGRGQQSGDTVLSVHSVGKFQSGHLKICPDYENLPMQYTEIFKVVKKCNFSVENFDTFQFLIQK